MVDRGAQPHLAFTTAGDPEQPALLLLHGFMSCNAQWLANLPELSQHYHLVMVELWGHGNSPTPSDPESYSVAAYISEFENIRMTLGITHWGAIGQSYGAGLIIKYAMQRPAACRAVVVTNSRSAFGALTRNRPSKHSDQDTKPFDPRKLPYHPIHARRFPAPIKEALVRAADQVTADAIRLGGALGQDLHSADNLGELTCPLLITNGKYEKSFQPELNQLINRYPSLQVAHLEGGHSVNIEAADAFNAAVNQFFKTHLASRRREPPC